MGLLSTPLSASVRFAIDMAKEILNLRAQGRASEVTDEMMKYADPQYLFNNTPLPMDTANRLNRAEVGGFDTKVPLYHSADKEIESINPNFKASFGGEKGAFYTTTNPDVANTYDGNMMQQFYGKTPEDALIVDAHNRGFAELDKETVTSQGILGEVVPQQFDKWSAGNRSIGRPEVIHTDMVSAGYPSDTTVFNRVKDEGSYNRIDPEDEFYDGTPSTVRADQNATNLRSTSARFDPEFSHLSNTLASNPIATTAAGAGGLLAMTGSEDSEAGVVSSANKAVRGLLNMDKSSRMARAKKQGFDTDKKVYHGTADDFDAFDPDRSIGTQFWSTTNKAEIESGDVGAQGSGVIKEMYHRIKNPAGWEEYDKFGIDELIREGYDGLKLPDGKGDYTYVAFDPSQYRSVDAAFDPAKTSSSNLLASNPVATTAAGAGGLLAMTGSEDSEAGVVSSSVKIAKEILNLRAQGRASEVTNEMMDAADPQYMFNNTPLPMDEASRLSRANAAGASTDMYHMTDKRFNAFANPSRSGMQGKGVYASSSPESGMDVPRGLGDLINKKEGLFVEGTNTMPLRFTGESFDESIQRLDPFSDEGTAVLKRFGLKPNKYYSKIKGAEEGSDISEQLYDLASRQATKKHGNQITSEWIEELKSSLNSRLKKAGYSSTEDSYTSNKMAFNPENVRSKFARFDPQFSNLKNLSASNPVATTSAGLLANVTGQPSNLSSYMQGNTDAYLTSAERQYLQNKQSFESNFSDDTGWDRADILPFRVNEQTGDVEFATPEMIKGLLSGIYDIGQSKNTKINNPASLLELI